MIRKTALAAIALMVSGGVAQAEIAFDKANRQILDTHILPGYAAFAETGDALAQSVDRYCAGDGAELAMVRQSMADAMGAWQSIQHIRFGPIAEDDRHFRLEFWPDKRNKTSKALAVLRRDMGEGKVVDAERIARTSVAAQGFPALERLVHDDEPLQPGSVDCQLAKLIAGNIASIAGNTASAWTDGGFADQVQSGEGYYQTPKDLAFELFKTLQTALQWVEDSKLRRPMGDDLGSARGRRTESWRSETSADHIIRNIKAIEGLYTANGNGGFGALLRKTAAGSDLHWGISGKLREAREALEKLILPLHEAVADPAQRRHLEKAVAELRELRRLVDADMASILDMPLGFNSLDGD